MWGQKWGEMVWNRASAVPALGLWGTLLLGGVLGVVAVLWLRSAKKTAIVVSLLVLLVPLSALGSVPFVFVPGTIADANQVNQNFAALTPVRGRTTASGASSTFAAVFVFPSSPSFVASRDMTRIVTVEPYVVAPPSFVLTWKPAIQVGSTQSTGPSIGPGPLTVPPIPSPGMDQNYFSSFTEVFSVTHGSSVSFGAQFSPFSTGLWQATVNVVYDCNDP